MTSNKQGSPSNDGYSAAELGQANRIDASERTPLMSELGRGPSASHEASPRKPSTSSSHSKTALSARTRRRIAFVVIAVSLLFSFIVLVCQVEAPPTPLQSKSIDLP
jgi:hypothetical protein